MLHIDAPYRRSAVGILAKLGCEASDDCHGTDVARRQKTAHQSPFGDGMGEVTCLVRRRDGKRLAGLFPAEVKIDSSVEKTSP